VEFSYKEYTLRRFANLQIAIFVRTTEKGVVVSVPKEGKAKEKNGDRKGGRVEDKGERGGGREREEGESGTKKLKK